MVRICVIDDEPMIRTGISMILEQAFPGKLEIYSAKDGESGMEIVRQKKCSIVITDIRMPELNGLTMIECMRREGLDTKFIILSGYDDFSYCKTALKLDVVDYLLKPVDEQELIRNVERLLEPLLEEAVPIADPQRSRLVSECLEYVKQNYAKCISLDILSEKFHYHGRYISQVFKKEMQINFVDYLNQVRIQRAKQLLLEHPYWRVEDIGAAVGFGDAKYFAKIFKRMENITPTEYREQSIY